MRLIFLVFMLIVPTVLFAQATDFFELVQTGTPQQVQTAISQGADVNAQENGVTVLMYAAQFNTDPEVVTILLNAGANVKARPNRDATALLLAARYNPNPEVITRLLKAGANPQDVNMLGQTALMVAARYNPNPQVIMVLMNAGANVKASDETYHMTALMYAAEFSTNPGTVEALLKAGADAMARDDEEKTALDYARDNAKLKDTDAYRQLQEASQ
ncbi:MAG: ankyrin repeat domain-containing protein [Spirochaetia bacterium]